MLENARAVRDAGGRIVGYEGTVSDITERKRAEQAIFAEKDRAQVTLQSIGDAVISTDADGRIDYLNPVAGDLTGWSLDEARGRADRRRAEAHRRDRRASRSRIRSMRVLGARRELVRPRTTPC